MGTGCFRRRATLAALLLLTLSAYGTIAVRATPALPHRLASAHAGILIESNAGFNATNGVTRGSGTAQDPYVIGPWDISPVWGSAVLIRNTTAYFVLQRLNVTSTGTNQWGVVLTNVTHARVLQVNVSGTADGLILTSVDGFEVASSNLSANTVGLLLRDVRNGSVANNSFLNNGPLASGVPTGEAIDVEASVSVAFTANNLTSNGLGVQATGSSGLRFTANRFIANAHQASDDSASDSWNGTYPNGGNFWSDYRGYDDCKGPWQNDCTGGDGLGDTPYGIATSLAQPLPTVLDHYPLVPVNPANMLPVAQFTLSTSTPWTGQAVTFDGTVAYDPDGFITEYQWFFGDGLTASGPTATHAYAAPGNYSAVLRVTDNRHGAMTATRSVRVTTWVRPAIPLVLWFSPKGYAIPIPSQWSRQENVSVGANTTMDLYAYGTFNGTAANLIVDETFDPTVREDRTYLVDALNYTVTSLRKQYPSVVVTGMTFRTLAGHTALDAVIRYGTLYQDVAILTSVDLHAGWVIVLTATSAEEGNLNATWQQILDGFTITAVPPNMSLGPGSSLLLWVAVGGATGAVLGAVGGLLYFAKRSRVRRIPPPPPLPPPGTA